MKAGAFEDEGRRKEICPRKGRASEKGEPAHVLSSLRPPDNSADASQLGGLPTVRAKVWSNAKAAVTF